MAETSVSTPPTSLILEVKRLKPREGEPLPSAHAVDVGGRAQPEPWSPNFHVMPFQPYPYPTVRIVVVVLLFTLYKDALFEFLHLYKGRVALGQHCLIEIHHTSHR